MRVSYQNHRQVKNRLQSLMPKGQRAIRRAVDREMEKIQTEIQGEVPVRTGDLKETGHQHKAKGREVIEAEIGYGRKKESPLCRTCGRQDQVSKQTRRDQKDT